MGKRKGVVICVDEGFFNTLERERKKEQEKLRKQMGGLFNLTQRNFTALLNAKKFSFKTPKNKVIRNTNTRRIIRRRKRRR